MSRMFTPEPELSGAPDTEIPETAPALEGPDEFEFVLGRRQVASVSLVVLALVGVCATVAYVAGKSVGRVVTVEAPSPVKSVPAPTAQPAAPVMTVASSILDAPLAGAPEVGKTYIQLGSVERGYATLMTHGARQLGFPAFIAPGTAPKLYRVLSGPFKSAEDLQKAKTIFDAAGLDSFVRKYAEAAAVESSPNGPTQP